MGHYLGRCGGGSYSRGEIETDAIYLIFDSLLLLVGLGKTFHSTLKVSFIMWKHKQVPGQRSEATAERGLATGSIQVMSVSRRMLRQGPGIGSLSFSLSLVTGLTQDQIRTPVSAEARMNTLSSVCVQYE